VKNKPDHNEWPTLNNVMVVVMVIVIRLKVNGCARTAFNLMNDECGGAMWGIRSSVGLGIPTIGRKRVSVSGVREGCVFVVAKW
jgi:hypothetical protein